MDASSTAVTLPYSNTYQVPTSPLGVAPDGDTVALIRCKAPPPSPPPPPPPPPSSPPPPLPPPAVATPTTLLGYVTLPSLPLSRFLPSGFSIAEGQLLASANGGVSPAVDVNSAVTSSSGRGTFVVFTVAATTETQPNMILKASTSTSLVFLSTYLAAQGMAGNVSGLFLAQAPPPGGPAPPPPARPADHTGAIAGGACGGAAGLAVVCAAVAWRARRAEAAKRAADALDPSGYDVFLSYRRADFAVADLVCDKLRCVSCAALCSDISIDFFRFFHIF